MGAEDRLETDRIWWGDETLPEGQIRRHRIGPYEFWLTRREHEWRFGEAGTEDEALATEPIESDTELPARSSSRGPVVRRLGFRRTTGRVRLRPRLADRPVVVQPRHMIALPPRQELVLFISSPLWLLVEVEEPVATLAEVPLQRPSDTWFGANTRYGELCYALRTSARLQLTDLPDRPHRAITELHVVNSAATALPIERIQVPLPGMSLFTGEGGRLWTQVVTLERPDDDELAKLELGRTSPSHVEGARLVSGPRETAPRVNLFRAFGGLIVGR